VFFSLSNRKFEESHRGEDVYGGRSRDFLTA